GLEIRHLLFHSELVNTSRGASRNQAAAGAERETGGSSTDANATTGRSRPSSRIVKSAAVSPRTGWRCPSSTETSSRTTSVPTRKAGGGDGGGSCARSSAPAARTNRKTTARAEGCRFITRDVVDARPDRHACQLPS